MSETELFEMGVLPDCEIAGCKVCGLPLETQELLMDCE